jgi:hypothetical protein
MSSQGTTREFTITREFAAPRELVFRAWTDPEHLTRWYGPRGFTTPRDSIAADVRPGGTWRATMIVDETGQEIPTGGFYLEVGPCPGKAGVHLARARRGRGVGDHHRAGRSASLAAHGDPPPRPFTGLGVPAGCTGAQPGQAVLEGRRDAQPRPGRPAP